MSRPPGPGVAPRRHRAFTVAAGVALLTLAACLDGGLVSLGGPLSFSLSVNQATVQQGRAHVFRMEAKGQQLLGLVIEYGDGSSDSIPTFNAQSASHDQAHIYSEPGEYLIRARAEEASGRVARDSLTVTVLPPS